MITTMRNEEKNQLIINKIVQDRKNSANKIINQFKYIYNPKLNIKKYLLIRNLLQKRNESSLKITAILKSFIVRKKVQNYLSKIKTNFVITRELSNEKNMQLNVFFGKIIKTFNFEYDPFIEKLAIYIPRNKINKKEYNVNFISDGKIIIDPKYYTTEENGYFVNIINFEKIKKEELEQTRKKEKEIKFICLFLRENGINLNNESGFNSLKTSASSIQGKNYFNKWNSLHEKLSYPKKKLFKPKSILKVSTRILNGLKKRRISEKNMFKRVSFGNVQFSY